MKKSQTIMILLVCLLFTLGMIQVDNHISYTVSERDVVQDSYNAIAVSTSKIKSNYKDGFISKTKAIIEFKFSINGFDNERKPGENHRLYIRPQNNLFVTPVYSFGKIREDEIDLENYSEEILPANSEIKVKFRIDFSTVLDSLKENGFYVTPTGDKIIKGEFEGLFIAGDTEPLSWNFGEIQKDHRFEFTDTDNDGIFECEVIIKTNDYRSIDEEGFAVWNLKKDISQYPQYSAQNILQESIYNMSLEELIDDIREDSTFMAGAKWHGVWTRDISYSIYLSLALIEPEIAKKSLLAKVNSDRIIQDTGTGGSWPVSTDRVVWATAAWEVYLVTGDKNWLNEIYTIIKNTLEADLQNALDNRTGLMFGESSFLDWREQSYPKWMDPKDIYASKCLGTNALHYKALLIMSDICNELGLDKNEYSTRAESLKNAINNYLWNDESGFYGQYLYGRLFDVISPKSETLGESLSIIFGIADQNRAATVIENLPVVEYGPPCFFPQIPNIPPYHNNAIWPFVSSYFTWAANRAGNQEAVEFGMKSIIRAASLFLTNKENMVASNGHFVGTEINSNRMLWSIAGNLAMTYRVIFGLDLTSAGIEFHPNIPISFKGKHVLNNFMYQKAQISVVVNGWGNKIKRILINGKEVSEAFIKSNSVGEYEVEIYLESNDEKKEINLVQNNFSPEIPDVVVKDNLLTWQNIPNAKEYKIVLNGVVNTSQKINSFTYADINNFAEISVIAVDSLGYESFMSEPVVIGTIKQQIVDPSEENKLNTIVGFTGSGYIQSTQIVNNEISFHIDFPSAGYYSIDFRYANGNGPINTNNACAIRSLYNNEQRVASIVLPQRGDKVWYDWGYSNAVIIKANMGNQKLSLRYEPINMNMSVIKNEAMIDAIRITLLK